MSEDLAKLGRKAEFLIEEGENNELKKLLDILGVNTKITTLGTPLSIACIYNNTEIAKYCIENGADVNVVDSSTDTPLITCCKTGNFELIKLLVEKGADINVKNKYDRTPITRAISGHSENYELIEYLLEHGADPFIKQEYMKDDPRITTYTAYDYAKQEVRDEKLMVLLDKYKK